MPTRSAVASDGDEAGAARHRRAGERRCGHGRGSWAVECCLVCASPLIITESNARLHGSFLQVPVRTLSRQRGAEIRAVGAQRGLHELDRNLAQRFLAAAGERGERSRRLAHDEAPARDARRRLAVVRHRRAAAGDEQVLRDAIAAARQQHAKRQLVEAARLRDRRPAPLDVAGDVQLERPAVDADRVGEARAADDLVAAQDVLADEAPRLADADLRRDLEQVGVLEARDARAQEAQVVDRLAPAFDLAARERARVGAVDRAAVGVLQLRDVDAPLARVALRPDDRAAAREAELAGRLGFVHARGNRPPRFAGARVVDGADAKHQRRKEQRAALLHRRAGEVGEVAVAGAVDEGRGADREPPRLRLDARARRCARARPARRRPRARGTAPPLRRRAASRRRRT